MTRKLIVSLLFAAISFAVCTFINLSTGLTIAIPILVFFVVLSIGGSGTSTGRPTGSTTYYDYDDCDCD